MSERLPLAGVDCAILVGGRGTRLGGLIDHVPKPLAPVLGRPFLFYLLDMLALRGARSVTLCSGHLANVVRESTGHDWLGMPLHHSTESTPLLTGGALALARPTLQSPWVLVYNGDTWFEPDFTSFVSSAENSDCCVAAVQVPDASRYGRLLCDAAGRLTAFEEKSPGIGPSPINSGVYLISQNVLGSLPLEPVSLEQRILPDWVARGRVNVHRSDGPFLDIGTPSDYAAAPAFFTQLGLSPHSMFPDTIDWNQAQPKLGTCLVIRDPSNRILLEQRSDCGWWGLPGGRLDAGETLAEGAKREAFEETGLQIEITGFLGIFSNPRRRTVRYPDNGDLRHLVDVAILARPTSGELSPSPESLELRWFSLDQIPLKIVPPAIEILRHACPPDGMPLLR
jgi:D-glycero-alpha-D-manno-heptose 1-phosphate guanylyltransferase